MQSISKISTITLYIMLAISVFAVGLFYAGGVVNPGSDVPEPKYTAELLYWMYALIGIGVVTTFVFALGQFAIQLKDSPKKAISTIAKLIGFVLLLVISWSIGNGTPLALPGYDGPDNIYFWLKLTDMFLYCTYILLGIAVLTMVFFAAIRVIRK